jgi:HSP20 family protein
MTMITRFEPFRDLNSLQGTLSRLFQNYEPFRGNDELTTTGNFVPAVDIYEDEHFLTLKLEVPGVDQKDLDVRVENNTLTIRGERKFEKEEKEENFHRIERRFGSFARSFTLPSTVNTENVAANYENGVLLLKLAKKAEARPKQIKVNIGSASQPKEVKGAGHAA